MSLTDSGHIILECLKCHASLVDIWRTKPELILHSKIKAKCCFCDGESTTTEVEGGIHLGDTERTNIVDTKFLDAEYELNMMVRQNVIVITSRS